MIELTDYRGNLVFIAPSAIALVEVVSDNRHGICATVRTHDGVVVEVREFAAFVAAKVREAAP